MRQIPASLETMYADLVDQLGLVDALPGSISTRKRGGQEWLYVTVRDGAVRRQLSLGNAESAEVQERAQAHRNAEQLAKGRRTTVSALKRARIPAPTLPVGRILEVLANAQLFEQGLTLIGTHAFRLYPCVLGYYLPGAVLATQDVDISAAAFVAPAVEIDLEEVLGRAEPKLEPVWRPTDVKPAKFRAGQLTIDIITRTKRGHDSPVVVKGLGVAGEALAFQEYLTEQTIDVAALYGAGVLVRVPEPARYAVHKLIVAGRRGTGDIKSRKDLRQAENIIDVLLETDEAALEEALEDGRGCGRAWKTAINTALRQIGREVRQGRLPLKVS